MGCDGGTIPTRCELVRTKKKPEQKDKTSVLATKWRLCSITQEVLTAPIMACELGRLYNREAILELLLDRSKFEFAAQFEHIRGLKDLKALNLTEDSSYDHHKNHKGDGYNDTHASLYICPVVGLEMNGKHKFSFLWSCSCVLSERALKEVKSDVCHKCGKAYTENDVIVLNGNEEEVELMRSNMEQRRVQAKLEKKSKKALKHKAEPSSSEIATDGPSSSKQSRLISTASLNGPTQEQEGSTKLTNGKTDTRSKLANGKNGRNSKLTSGKVCLQKNPKTSSVYKSLFTSSKEAQNRPTAHWVTFNPQYF